VLTSEVPLPHLFLDSKELTSALESSASKSTGSSAHVTHASSGLADPDFSIDSAARLMMDDLGLSMAVMKESNLFSGDEERFAFSRALSRLSEMGSQQWVERGLGVGAGEWGRVRSKWREDTS
jgi:hypothetical protein